MKSSLSSPSPRFLLVVLILLFPKVALSQLSQSQLRLTLDQQSEIQDLAARVLKHADSAGCKKTCSILVANFTGETGRTSQLGVQLADEVSEQLAAQAKGLQIVSRHNLQQYLERERIPSKLLEDDNAARWLATENGATVVLIGYLKVGLREATLRAQLLDTKDFATRGAAAKTRIEEAVLRDIGNLGGLDPDEPFPPSPKDLPGEREQFQTDMVPPSCPNHVDPGYTDAARRAKFNGTLVLQVLFSAEGQIVAAQPLKGAPYGLNQSAERTVRGWKCQAATKDGKPVAVLVPVEASFRTF